MNIKKRLSLIAFMLFTISLSAQITMRGGLDNLFSKIEMGDSIAVAYLGGSITAQGGWRIQSLDYLKERYQGINFTEINATIGGTGSDLGSLRIDYDLLRKKPDLLFVEFAVNDSSKDSTMLASSMEAIVRKTWRKYPDCDICFVYTFKQSMLEGLFDGRYDISVSAHEAVADRYQIPSIHLGREAVELIRSGEMEIKPADGAVMQVSGSGLNRELSTDKDGKLYFSPDGVHPFLNTGHKLYTKQVVMALEQCEAARDRAAKHKLGKPLSKSGRDLSAALYIDSSMQSGEWNEVDDDYFKSKFQTIWGAEVGAKAEFSFKGSTLIAYDFVGPGSVKLKVTVDGEQREVVRFDGHCTYWRIASFTLAEGLDPKSEHNVEIEVIELEGKRELLFERNRANYDNNTSPYLMQQWRVGNFFCF